MKNNKEYWIERAKDKDKILEKSQKELEKELKSIYKEILKELKKELAYLKSTEEEELTEWQEYRINESINSIENSLTNLAQTEEELLTNGLTNTFKNSYEFEKVSLGANFSMPNDILIKQLIKTNWSGLEFSERIWNRRDKLVAELKEVLKGGLIRGDSLQDMSRLLADKLNKSYNNALVLVHTETCWVQSEATLKSYEEAGLEKYEFMAFLDERTTKECKSLDGKVFKLEEAVAGVNLPPLHCRCRSCIIPVLD